MPTNSSNLMSEKMNISCYILVFTNIATMCQYNNSYIIVSIIDAKNTWHLLWLREKIDDVKETYILTVTVMEKSCHILTFTNTPVVCQYLQYLGGKSTRKKLL